MTLEELQATVERHMLLADKQIVKLMCAFMVAARLPIDPPWLFLVGSSSGGKSMLLAALEECKGIFPLDDLTANTFFSGMKKRDNEETSLIERLIPNSVITFKDFTTIISKEKEARAIIIGQLRKIYDGDFSKQYGNGVSIKWKGKIAILAGVTSKVYTTMHMFQDMGERFLMYTFDQPDRILLGMEATKNLDRQVAKKAMREAFKEFIDGIKIPQDVHNVDNDTRQQIVELSELATRARSAVERDDYSRAKTIKQVHFLEMPPRFASQLLAIALGLSIVNGDNKLNDTDRSIIYKMALDSIPDTRRKVLVELTRFAKAETKAIALKLKYPVDSVRVWLQDLAALGVIDFTQASNKRDNWELQPHYRTLMGKFEHIELTDDILIEEDLEDIPTPEEPPAPTETAQRAIGIMGGGEIIE